MVIDVISLDLQPHLVGDLLELRPLRPEDWDGLFLAASDPQIWRAHPARDRYKEEVFREYFREALESGGALVAVDRTSDRIIGASRYFRHGPDQTELEIGWTFLARAYWGGDYNGEMKRLMLDHAFQVVDRVLFLVATTNGRSRRALEKIGGVLTDRIEKRRIHDAIVDHVVYEIRRPRTRW
ncbi:MAG: GNAT family N-acetyltransferase [Acidobacteriota bacterium]